MTNMAGEQRGAASEGGRARKKRHVMRESADAAEETDGARCERQRTNNNRGSADSQHGHVQTVTSEAVPPAGEESKGYALCGTASMHRAHSWECLCRRAVPVCGCERQKGGSLASEHRTRA